VRKTKEKKTEPLGLATNAGIGALFALVFTFLLLFVSSFLVVSGRLPAGWMGEITVAALFLSSLVGALFAIRRNRSRALFVGLAEGAILYVLTFIGGVFAETPSFFGGISIFLFLAAILGGAVAGLFAVRPKKRKL